MVWWEGVLLVVGGFAAGFINANAGGASVLTVPLLVLAGVPGNSANASNRVGIFTSSLAAATAFRRLGVRGLRSQVHILVPIVVGSLIGSFGISRLTDAAFERVFGLLMLPVVVMSLRPPRLRADARAWPLPVTIVAFLGVGIYGGAVQAGVGLIMLFVLTRSGVDLVSANNVKAVANLAITAVALAVFIPQGRVAWGPALILATGLTAGAYAGAHAAVKGGERFIRGVMVISAALLAGELLGVYDWLGDRL